MAKRITPLQAEKAIDYYLDYREKLLQKKVDKLSLQLFDKISEKYFKDIFELTKEGNIVFNSKNINAVNALDEIYKSYNTNYNIPVVKSFITDLQGIVPLNENYFSSILNKNLSKNSKNITASINNRLGLNSNGKPKQNGFVDKFIRDKSVLKAIKKTLMKSITNGDGIQELRKKLKESIQGVTGQPLSGALQQYYRNFAYDTFVKVDRMSSDMFAKDFGLRYFYYTGGVINTTRPFCEKCNGLIVDSFEFKTLTYKSLKEDLRGGIPDGKEQVWEPLNDLGGYGCRHRNRYILDEIANLNPSKKLNINILIQ